jgi:uncharacterized protein YecT (DUF1311 family)
MKTGAWVFGGAALLTAMAWANAASATSPEFDKCVDKSGGVTTAMRDCAFAEEARQDRDLNAFYKQAMARRDAAGRQQLRTQERAWLKQTKKKCDELLKGEGTVALLNFDDCWLETYDKRVAELKALANGHP